MLNTIKRDIKITNANPKDKLLLKNKTVMDYVVIYIRKRR